jgi:hypothetical protein
LTNILGMGWNHHANSVGDVSPLQTWLANLTSWMVHVQFPQPLWNRRTYGAHSAVGVWFFPDPPKSCRNPRGLRPDFWNSRRKKWLLCFSGAWEMALVWQSWIVYHIIPSLSHPYYINTRNHDWVGDETIWNHTLPMWVGVYKLWERWTKWSHAWKTGGPVPGFSSLCEHLGSGWWRMIPQTDSFNMNIFGVSSSNSFWGTFLDDGKSYEILGFPNFETTSNQRPETFASTVGSGSPQEVHFPRCGSIPVNA